jgi:hypothetical protein
MIDGYQVDPQALQETAKGINDAIAELKTLGFVGEAMEGRGFGNIILGSDQLGHPGLASSFSDFTDRWGWGVRALIQDGNEIARRLGLSAGMYWEQEQYTEGALKDAVTSAMGNPHLTDEQAEQRSWSQTMSDNPVNDDLLHADYSAESSRQANADIAKTWTAEGMDYVNTTWQHAKVVADPFALPDDK